MKAGRMFTLGVSVAMILASMSLAGWASAQYIYLDTNGDGSHSSADKFACSGFTTLDIWLDTAFNRNGTFGLCPTGNVYSYQFIVRAVGGTVEWGGFTNALADFTLLPSESNDSDFHAAALGPVFAPVGSGRYKLGALRVRVTSGCAGLSFVDSSPLKVYYATSFGSDCVSERYDNTLRLGEDWQDLGVIAEGDDYPAPHYRVPVGK